MPIPLGDGPVPARGGQPCPLGIAAVRLTIAEAARIEGLARQHAAGMITRARLAFCLRWSRWRRRHKARARWHHYSTRLLAAAARDPAKSFMRSEAALASAAGRGRGGGWRRRCWHGRPGGAG